MIRPGVVFVCCWRIPAGSSSFLWRLPFVQLLNGLTFPAMWVAGVSYAYENAPAGMGTTAQGIFSATVFGLGTAVGGFAGGLLLESVGGRGLHLVFGVVLLAVVAIVTLIQRRLPAEQKTSTRRAVSR